MAAPQVNELLRGRALERAFKLAMPIGDVAELAGLF
jgi:hypothetical protein